MQPYRKKLFVTISLIGVCIGIFASYELRWLGDDIFIALRYVQNFVNGDGLVYNIGERVEGYTDFLWIMLISVFARLNLDLPPVTQALGILAATGTLIICSLIGYKLMRKQQAFVIPFLTLALALNYDFAVWATSGLETSFYGFLLCMSFYFFFFSGYTNYLKWLLSGFFLTLALLTRPDALLFVAVSNAVILFYHLFQKVQLRQVIRVLLLFNLTFVLIYIPYFIWRYNYYGFLFPNTYYVKLGYESCFGKGIHYLWLYFKPHFTSFLIVLLPPLVLWPIIKKKSLQQFRVYLSDTWNAAFMFCLLVVYTYMILYIAKVGGDFMHARFVIPMIPFIAFIILHSLVQLIPTPKILNRVLSFLLLCSFAETLIRIQLFKIKDDKGNTITILLDDVADERWYYTALRPIEAEIEGGQALHDAFEGVNARLLIRGAQACLGYYANFNYIQEYHGLTDTAIAHSPITSRGRIGHEKKASYEYLQNKGIHFIFNNAFSDDAYKFGELKLPFYIAQVEMITYDNVIMDQLKQRLGDSFTFTDFRTYLDNYIMEKLTVVSKEQLKKDYADFYSYYFRHNNDKIRENKFLEILNN